MANVPAESKLGEGSTEKLTPQEQLKRFHAAVGSEAYPNESKAKSGQHGDKASTREQQRHSHTHEHSTASRVFEEVTRGEAMDAHPTHAPAS